MSGTPTETFDVRVDDVAYLERDGAALMARVYVPAGAGPFPMLAEIHGGAWCRGSRLDEDLLNRELARHGIAVAALDFRMPPDAGYPASIADINLAVRWLKANAARWHTRQEAIGLLGVSSGAHQAMLAAMRPSDPRYAATPLPGAAAGLDARVAFVVMGWPVIDPLGRYRYALALQAGGRPYPEAIDRVIPDHLRYWGDEAAMDEGSPLRILERGEPVDTPPVLCLQGERDLVHPREHLERFAEAYRGLGGTLRLRWFPDEAEGFAKTHPDGPSARAAVEEIVRFVRTQGART